LIFVGDIALPDNEGIHFLGIPTVLKQQTWIGNFEGALVDEKFDKGVYNYEKGFSKYLGQVPLHIACLANNHITDTGSIAQTKKKLTERGIQYLGAGNNSREAAEPLVTDSVVFLNFGWSVIQCIPAGGQTPGVNELTNQRVLSQFREAKTKYPDKKIIPVFHWNYELELYPMPRQRELARQLIDEGAEIIIGHHSHLVQGVEIYRGKYIVHGLGNWAFKQRAYYNEKLAFPTMSLLQMAFEYSITTGKGCCHYFDYNINENKISFLRTEEVDGETNSKLTPFHTYDKNKYNFFFKKKRLKRKILPVYYSDDSNFIVDLKNSFMKLRDIGIGIVSKINK